MRKEYPDDTMAPNEILSNLAKVKISIFQDNEYNAYERDVAVVESALFIYWFAIRLCRNLGLLHD